MPRIGENLVGNTYHRLTVLSKNIEASKRHKRPYWDCKCECGNIKTIAGLSLKNGSTKSCGCLRNEKVFEALAKDEKGNVYGKLTVLEMDSERDNFGRIKWICKCECGNIKSISGSDLRSGNTTSCGCFSRISKGEQKIIDILEEHNISYIREYKPENLGQKRFDFAILDNSNKIIRLVEYDGEQHYHESNWERSKLSRTQASDAEKNNYATINNIPLVRIPYWEYDNMNYEMIFGESFLV